MALFNYIMRKVWYHQTRIGLSLYDVVGQGYLREVVSYAVMLIHSAVKDMDRKRSGLILGVENKLFKQTERISIWFKLSYLHVLQYSVPGP